MPFLLGSMDTPSRHEKPRSDSFVVASSNGVPFFTSVFTSVSRFVRLVGSVIAQADNIKIKSGKRLRDIRYALTRCTPQNLQDIQASGELVKAFVHIVSKAFHFNLPSIYFSAILHSMPLDICIALIKQKSF